MTEHQHDFIRRYIADPRVLFVWGDLPDGTMGQTSLMSDGRIWITLDWSWHDHDGICQDAVLWHEICHAQAMLEGASGHGSTWMRHVWSKPVYAVVDLIASPIAYRLNRRTEQ